MPMPSVEPIPPGPARRPRDPLLAHDASYFAASARIESFSSRFIQVRLHQGVVAVPNIRRSTPWRQRTRHPGTQTLDLASLSECQLFAPRCLVLAQTATDVRYAARIALRRRWVSLAILLSIGFGIAGTTAIFAVIDRVLLRPLPVSEGHRAVWIRTMDSGDGRA